MQRKTILATIVVVYLLLLPALIVSASLMRKATLTMTVSVETSENIIHTAECDISHILEREGNITRIVSINLLGRDEYLAFKMEFIFNSTKIYSWVDVYINLRAINFNDTIEKSEIYGYFSGKYHWGLFLFRPVDNESRSIHLYTWNYNFSKLVIEGTIKMERWFKYDDLGLEISIKIITKDSS